MISRGFGSPQLGTGALCQSGKLRPVLVAKRGEPRAERTVPRRFEFVQAITGEVGGLSPPHP